MEGDLSLLQICLSLQMFQSTPSRGGRPRPCVVAYCYTTVSIHALAWRATLGIDINFVRRDDVSIHALAWRATFAGYRTHPAPPRFNPRPSRGGRPGVDGRGHHGPEVSIHALAWRATNITKHHKTDYGGFNPRPRVEGDRNWNIARVNTQEFQSTPSRGGRPRAVMSGRKGYGVSIHA